MLQFHCTLILACIVLSDDHDDDDDEDDGDGEMDKMKMIRLDVSQ